MKKLFKWFSKTQAPAPNVYQYMREGRYLPIIELINTGYKLNYNESQEFNLLIKSKLEDRQYEILEHLAAIQYTMDVQNTYSLISHYLRHKTSPRRQYIEHLLSVHHYEILNRYKSQLNSTSFYCTYAEQSQTVEGSYKKRSLAQDKAEQIKCDLLNPDIIACFPKNQLNAALTVIRYGIAEFKGVYKGYMGETEFEPLHKVYLKMLSQEKLLIEGIENIDKKPVLKRNPMSAELMHTYTELLSEVEKINRPDLMHLKDQLLPDLKAAYEAIAPNANTLKEMQDNLLHIKEYLATFQKEDENLKEFQQISRYLRQKL